MLFPKQQWAGLADGSITVAFRRWRRPTVRAGGTLRSPGGVLAIDAVDVIEPGDISDDDARAAGAGGAAEVLTRLRPEGTLYRIRFHRIGDDDRLTRRDDVDLDGPDGARALTSAERLPWAADVLALIAERPGVVSTELAATLGQERPAFKQRVRRLKELGLTESLEVGYRLSPRGRAVLDRLSAP